MPRRRGPAPARSAPGRRDRRSRRRPPADADAGDAGAVAALIAAGLRDVPDFPQPGVLFKDIVPLLADGAVASARSIRALAGFAAGAGPVELVAGVEARGFIFAAPLARELGCGLVPVRKAGKLPPPTLRAVLRARVRHGRDRGAARRARRAAGLPGRRRAGHRRHPAAAVDLIGQAGGTVLGLGVLLELGLSRRTGAARTGRTRALLRI